MDRKWIFYLILFIKTTIAILERPNELSDKPVIVLYISDLTSDEDRSKVESLKWATDRVNKHESLPIKIELRPIDMEEWSKKSYDYLLGNSPTCKKSPSSEDSESVIIGAISTFRTPQLLDYFYSKGIPLLFESQIKTALNYENKLQILKEILERFEWKNPNIISPEENLANNLSNYGFCHVSSSSLPRTISDIKDWASHVSRKKSNIAVFDYKNENKLFEQAKDSINWIYFDNRTITNQLSTAFTVGENQEKFNLIVNDLPVSKRVFGVMDIFYLLVNKFKLAYAHKCSKKAGLCREFVEFITKGSFMSNFNEFEYSSFKKNSVPESFVLEKRTVKLNENFEVIVDWLKKTYEIFKTASFQSSVKIADFSGKDFNWRIPESPCKSCGKCFSSSQQSYKYLNNLTGRLLIGYLPVMNGKGDGFSCSEDISTGGYGTYMAFRYGLQIAKSLTGINYDLLLIDECGEALRPISVMGSIREDKKVNLSSTLAIIGTISSDLSENIYQISKALNTVQISYGSTSAMFDDKSLYPNFLRTVPSDDQQAEALIMIIKEFKWNCFHLMFDGTAYGRTGANNVRKYAQHHDLHISEDREVSSEYLRGIAGFQILKSKKTKVILYFGMSETGKRLLSVMSRTQAIGKYIFVMSESWGDDQEHIRGLQDVPRALISLKLNTPFLEPNDFQQFYQKHITKPDITDPWTVNYMRQHKCENSKCPETVHLTQYAQYAFLSVLSTTLGVQSSLKKVCNKDTFCEKFRNQPETLVRELKKVEISGNRIFSGRNGRYGYYILNMKRTRDETYYEKIGTFYNSRNVSLLNNSSDASNRELLREIESYIGDHKLHDSPMIARTWAIAATVFSLVLMSVLVLLLFWWRKRTAKVIKKFPTAPINYNEISDIYVQAKKRHIYENLDREIETASPPNEETRTKSTESSEQLTHISQLKYRLLFGEDPKEESRYSSTPTKEKSITNDLMPLDAGYLERHARLRQSLPLTFDPATRPLPPISERKTPVVKFSTVPKNVGKKMVKEVHANLAFVMDDGSDGSLNDESYSEVVL